MEFATFHWHQSYCCSLSIANTTPCIFLGSGPTLALRALCRPTDSFGSRWRSIEHGTCMHYHALHRFRFVRFCPITSLHVTISHNFTMPHWATSPCCGRSKAHALVWQNWTGKIFLQDLIRFIRSSDGIGCARYFPNSKNQSVRYRWEKKIYTYT